SATTRPTMRSVRHTGRTTTGCGRSRAGTTPRTSSTSTTTFALTQVAYGETASYLRRHHVALFALFFAFGGTSFAATGAVQAKNSVGTRQAQLSPPVLARLPGTLSSATPEATSVSTHPATSSLSASKTQAQA